MSKLHNLSLHKNSSCQFFYEKKKGTSLENLKLHGEPTENHSGEEAQDKPLGQTSFSVISVGFLLSCNFPSKKEKEIEIL